MSIGTTAIELRVFKKREKKKHGKIILGIIFDFDAFLLRYLVAILLSFHMFSAIKLL